MPPHPHTRTCTHTRAYTNTHAVLIAATSSLTLPMPLHAPGRYQREYWRCDSGDECIDVRFKCDGAYVGAGQLDCSDGSDETLVNCPNMLNSTTTTTTTTTTALVYCTADSAFLSKGDIVTVVVAAVACAVAAVGIYMLFHFCKVKDLECCQSCCTSCTDVVFQCFTPIDKCCSSCCTSIQVCSAPCCAKVDLCTSKCCAGYTACCLKACPPKTAPEDYYRDVGGGRYGR